MNNLKTVQNFARMSDVSTAHIYRLVHSGVLSSEVIDGVYFVDILKSPTIPGDRKLGRPKKIST